MAQRPIWRGHLRLALVSCPVALYSARHDRGTIRFNMINPETGNRIKMVSQDAETGEEVSRGQTVKGYEYEKGRYVIVTDEDMEKVRVESSTLMMVEKFVDSSSIDPIYYDASYYLAPDGKGAEDVYAVLREAIRTTGKVALTRVVIAQRERTVAVRPMEGGLVAHTLNEARDLNSSASLFDVVGGVAVDAEMVKLAVALVDRQTGEYDAADLDDRYEMRLREMLEAKVKGEGGRFEAAPAPAESNIVDLMAALRRSLGQSGAQTGPEVAAGKPVAAGRKKKTAEEEVRRQPGFKLPIAGGRAAGSAGAKAEPVAAPAAAPAKGESGGAGKRRKAS